MRSSNDSCWRARIELERVRTDLARRLDALESAAKAPPAPLAPTSRLRALGTGFVKWMGGALPQLLTGLVTLVIAFWIKDSVDIAIKQQQLQLSYVEKMKSEMSEMANAASPQAAERSAMLIATFGRPAIMPLVNELQYGGNRLLGAEVGLRSLAFTDTDAVCDVVRRALESPARLFGIEGYMAAARTLAAAGCAPALPSLRRHLALVQEALDDRNPAKARAFVRETPEVTHLKEMKKAIENAISDIEIQRPRWWKAG